METTIIFFMKKKQQVANPDSKRNSFENAQTIKKGSAINLINLMRSYTGNENLVESPLWKELENFVKDLESIIEERDSLLDQLSQVKEGAIEALMEKEEIILDLMTKLKGEMDRKAEHGEREARQYEVILYFGRL